jgi:Nickel responsive protein SCO4226-like
VPRYLVERRFTVTEDAMPAVGRKSRTVLRDEVTNVTWELSHVVVGEDGLVTTFCIYVAPNEDDVLRHSRLLGEHHIASLYEIAGDVTPNDFPLDEPAA